jgi:enoyl-CoA hydratase/carnithine racemase
MGVAVVTYQDIRYEVDDPVATITLDRPDALNGWTGRMGAEVRHAIARAEADRAVVGIVITGAGRAFCAGADMNDLATLTEGGALESSWPELEVAPDPDLPGDFAGTFTYLLATKKLVVAAINGAIAGMAVPIALCCDVRFMAEDALFLTAFARRGLIAEYGVSWLLARVAGTANAIDLLLSSRRITGAEAARLGVVNEALPVAEVLPRAQKYVEDAAATCSPRSIAIMKRQIYAQIHAGLGPAEYESRRLMVESFGRRDFGEGVTSFREKRPPNFERLGDSES